MTLLETNTARVPLLPSVDLNRERREERRGVLRRSRRHAIAILATVTLAVMVPLPLTLQALVIHRNCQKAEHQVTEVHQRLQLITANSSVLGVKISRWTRLINSQQARHAWAATLPTLAVCLPDDVSLQQVQISRDGKSARIELQGSGSTMTEIYLFTSALTRTSVFAHMHLDETTTSSSGVNFRMTGPLSGSIANSAEPSTS